MNDSVMAKVSRIKAAGPLTTARPVVKSEGRWIIGDGDALDVELSGAIRGIGR